MANIEQLDNFLGKFSCQSILLKISEFSRKLFCLEKSFDYISVEPNGNRKVAISQWGLAFLAFRSILRSNDGRKGKFSDKDLAYSFSMFNNLDDSFSHDNDILSFMGRISQEQIGWQKLDLAILFSRYYHLLVEIPESIKLNDQIGEKIDLSLDEKFLEAFGISIQEFLVIGFVAFARAISTSTFNAEGLMVSDAPKLSKILTHEKIDKFLALISADYNTLRKSHQDIHFLTYSGFERYEFNPLLKYPITRSDPRYPHSKKYEFTVPHVVVLAQKITTGVYWELRDLYSKENKKESRDFLKAFGLLFEQYVGEILRKYFGEEKVAKISGVGHKNLKKHADWIVKLENHVLIFECKSSLIPIKTKQTFNRKLLANWIEEVFVKGAKQLASSEAMAISAPEYRGKKVCKFLVTHEDIFFSEEKEFKDFVASKIKEKYGNSISFYNISIQDLELLEIPIREIGVEEIIKRKEEVDADVSYNLGRGLVAVSQNIKSFSCLRNEFLLTVYRQYFEDVLGF